MITVVFAIIDNNTWMSLQTLASINQTCHSVAKYTAQKLARQHNEYTKTVCYKSKIINNIKTLLKNASNVDTLETLNNIIYQFDSKSNSIFYMRFQNTIYINGGIYNPHSGLYINYCRICDVMPVNRGGGLYRPTNKSWYIVQKNNVKHVHNYSEMLLCTECDSEIVKYTSGIHL